MAELTKEIWVDAPPETVYRYLVEPDLAARWIGDESWNDPRTGGVYRVSVRGNVARGEFVELQPNRRNAPSAASMIDVQDGQGPPAAGPARHLLSLVDVAIVAKAPIDQFTAWGKERGWRFAPLYASAHTTFNRDYQAESDEWGQLPIAHVFTRSDGTIHHRWSSELFTAQNEPGQHPRHVDYMWPLWKVLDVTPAGRGSDWEPRYAYDP